MDNTCPTCVFWEPNQKEVEQRDDAKYICTNPEVGIRTRKEFGCTLHMGPNDTEVNVPQHVRNGTMTEPNPNKLNGPTEVLIITHHKDFEWLIWALRCVTKHLSGFQGVTVAHPNVETERFRPLLDQFKIRLHGYDEVPGKGMVQHFAKMAEADLFLPSGTKYVLTLDADGMFHTPSTPEHFAWQDKPYWIVRTWESLTTEDPNNPGSKIVSDCTIWRGPTDAQLGFTSDLYTMCVNCQLMPLDLLPHYRSHVESVHRKPFLEYFLEGQNSFPQTRVDYNALGAYFYRFHRERFHWFDVEKPPFPKDRKRSYWSHGGIGPDVQKEIDGFIR